MSREQRNRIVPKFMRARALFQEAREAKGRKPTLASLWQAEGLRHCREKDRHRGLPTASISTEDLRVLGITRKDVELRVPRVCQGDVILEVPDGDSHSRSA